MFQGFLKDSAERKKKKKKTEKEHPCSQEVINW
jgi:hypothetical protein